MQRVRLSTPLVHVGRVLALFLPAFVFVGTPALAGATTLSWLNATPLPRTDNVCLGIVCGLLIWLFAAALLIRRQRICLPVRDRAAWMSRVTTLLEDLGYRLERYGDNLLIFEPRFQALLFGGNIRIRVRMDVAFVVGPRIYLHQLRQRLRMSSYLRPDTKFPQEHKHGRVDRRWRQIEITVQVPREQWHEVHDAVLAPLSREGADVVCQINIVARGKAGIRDALVEGPIRHAFARHGLRAEIHKQPVSAPELAVATEPDAMAVSSSRAGRSVLPAPALST